MSTKEKLIDVFNQNALAYDTYRPKYPSKLVKDVITLSNLKSPDKILEIGCGTGQITIPFLEKGFALTAIEKGEALAHIANQKIKKYPLGQLIHATFEDWETQEKFKLVISAQAFHWIEKEKGIDKILNTLEEQGSVALIWNLDMSQETAFWKDSAKIYEKYLSEKKGNKSQLKVWVKEYETYLQSRTEFTQLIRKEYDWEKIYSQEEYLGLLSTFSTHMTLSEQERKTFFQEMTQLMEAHNNQVEKYYKMVLIFAKKKSFENE